MHKKKSLLLCALIITQNAVCSLSRLPRATTTVARSLLTLPTRSFFPPKPSTHPKELWENSAWMQQWNNTNQPENSNPQEKEIRDLKWDNRYLTLKWLEQRKKEAALLRENGTLRATTTEQNKTIKKLTKKTNPYKKKKAPHVGLGTY